MKYVRVIVWVLVLVALVAFSVANWTEVNVRIWDGFVWDTKLPAPLILAFLLGLVPMWVIHRSVRWRLERRLAGLETAHRQAIGAAAATPPSPTPPLNEPTVSP